MRVVVLGPTITLSLFKSPPWTIRNGWRREVAYRRFPHGDLLSFRSRNPLLDHVRACSTRWRKAGPMPRPSMTWYNAVSVSSRDLRDFELDPGYLGNDQGNDGLWVVIDYTPSRKKSIIAHRPDCDAKTRQLPLTLRCQLVWNAFQGA